MSIQYVTSAETAALLTLFSHDIHSFAVPSWHMITTVSAGVLAIAWINKRIKKK